MRPTRSLAHEFVWSGELDWAYGDSSLEIVPRTLRADLARLSQAGSPSEVCNNARLCVDSDKQAVEAIPIHLLSVTF